MYTIGQMIENVGQRGKTLIEAKVAIYHVQGSTKVGRIIIFKKRVLTLHSLNLSLSIRPGGSMSLTWFCILKKPTFCKKRPYYIMNKSRTFSPPPPLSLYQRMQYTGEDIPSTASKSRIFSPPSYKVYKQRDKSVSWLLSYYSQPLLQVQQ